MELSKQDGWTRALLVRRSIDEKPESAYYLCHARGGKDRMEALVRVAGERWKFEQCFETAKGECGLDHYEVRHLLTGMLWRGWHGLEHLLTGPSGEDDINSKPCAATIESAVQLLPAFCPQL